MDNGAFFLRGFARSGTNWLGKIINLHPDVLCRGEFHLEDLAIGFSKTKSKSYGHLKDSPHFENLFLQFIDNLIKIHCHGAPYYGDRTPISIRECLIPKSKYIVIFRDVRDVLVSLYYHNLLHPELDSSEELNQKRRLFDSNNLHFEESKNDLLDCERITRGWAKMWSDHVKSDLEAISEAAALNIEVLPVLYEALHANPDERDRIYQFLNLNPFDAFPLDEETSPGITSPDVTSHNRKGLPGEWENYFTQEQLEWVNSEAGDTLKLVHKFFNVAVQ